MKMKPAISITTTILVSVLAVGLASAQSPSAVQTTRDKVTAVGVKGAASKDALGVRQAAPAAASAKPAAPSSRIAVAPEKASSAGAKHTGAAKPVAAVAAKHSAEPKAAVVASKGSAPKGNPPAAVAASNGASESGQGEAAASEEQGEAAASEEQVKPTGKNSANGRRDPFVSPVVSRAGGSGCSTGKKCLEIGAINLRGVVHAESGFIAVVSNSLNKAYFLRENDPVFNGYVVKITGDSIVFQETVQDRLGKTFTREVVKKITTPAV
jgi:hypothetical protein